MKLRQYIWILLGSVAIAMNSLFARSHSFYDNFYFRGVYPLLRIIYDYTFGLLPFPTVYVVFFVLIYYIAQLLKFKDFRTAKTLQSRVLGFVSPILSFFGLAIFTFYFFWGFNYQQKPLSKTLELPSIKADTAELFDEAMYFLDNINHMRYQLSRDTNALNASFMPSNMEGQIRASLTGLLDEWEMPTYGRVRIRRLLPRGILLRISTAGVYIPFVFEGHIDAGLHPIQQPFVMAHEMSHGYGITDEGTCNFTGFLAAANCEDDFIRYSAFVGVWRYMANNLRRYAPNSYKIMMRQMSKSVRNDMTAIYDRMDQYPDILPEIRDKVYDSYLKTHGVQGGLSNYGTVVRLVMSWKNSGLNPRIQKKIYK